MIHAVKKCSSVQTLYYRKKNRRRTTPTCQGSCYLAWDRRRGRLLGIRHPRTKLPCYRIRGIDTTVVFYWTGLQNWTLGCHPTCTFMLRILDTFLSFPLHSTTFHYVPPLWLILFTDCGLDYDVVAYWSFHMTSLWCHYDARLLMYDSYDSFLGSRY